jgi:hypothetical protein
MQHEALLSCLRSRLERLEAAYRLSSVGLPSSWNSIEWQHMKHLIARAAAPCLCRILGCRLYLSDVHGGEPSEGLGGKDIDLILDCPSEVDTEAIEEELEQVIYGWLQRLLGGDPYQRLGIPNIVELHTTREFLFKKYVEAGPPYAVRLC